MTFLIVPPYSHSVPMRYRRGECSVVFPMRSSVLFGSTWKTFGPPSGPLLSADFGNVPRLIDVFSVDVSTGGGGNTYSALLPLAVPHKVGGEDALHLGVEGLVASTQGSLRPEGQIDVQAPRDARRRPGD